jgi:hypothetical protein
MTIRSYNLLDTARGDFVLNAQTINQILGIGNSWFVNELTGNDNNQGSSSSPFATLDAALAASTANNNDVVYLMGSSHRSTILNWNKNGVSIVGLTAPSDNDRARISTAASLTQPQWTALGPLVNVTAQGCSFINLGSFHGYGASSLTAPTTPICWQDLGGRNRYSNVQFFGGGDSNTALNAAMRSLVLGGSGENVLVDCTYGLDTVERITNANATLEIVDGSPRNILQGGIFQAWNGLAGNQHILVQANGMDRSLVLDDVTLHNFGTAMTAAISNAGGSPSGDIILTPSCISVGANAIATTGNVWVGQISAGGGGTTGLGVLAT